MFFIASKALWLFAAPSALLIVGALIGVVVAGRRFGRRLAVVCLLGLLAIGAAPLGALVMAPLENRFPLPPANLPAPVGIVILGGAIDDEISRARHQTTFDEGGERLSEAAALARKFPSARIIYSGGSSSLLGRPVTEGEEARGLLIALGVEPQRIMLETNSRNTDENARFTAAMVHPQADQAWLIVTSAYHMPRAMGLFRKAGFAAIAAPTDYRTAGGRSDWRLNFALPYGLGLFDLGVHEWIGLIAYRLSGRIDDLFPGP
jgi:uncharacterized SAM-binding protein YcdF (DUF218 family)